MVIIGILSYVDKFNFGRTSKRFYKLVNTKHMKYCNDAFKQFFVDQNLEDFLSDFIHRFTLKYYFFYPYKCDRLYLVYFFFILKEKLTIRMIYGLLFWCQRKNFVDSECKFCCQVFRWNGDTNNQLIFSKCYTDFWDTHSEQVFVQDTYLSENLGLKKRCGYFENVCTVAQLVNFFGIIACRLFLNVGKRVLFVGKICKNEDIYRFYAKFTDKLFKFICEKVRYDYANVAIYSLKPYVDYDCKYFKVVNLHYIDYLKKKKCI